MARFILVFLVTSLFFSLLLCAAGDFTHYVGDEPKGLDFLVLIPSGDQRFTQGIWAGLGFGLLSTILFRLAVWLSARYRAGWSFLVGLITVTLAIYLFGPFKTYFPPPGAVGVWEVHYEMPWGLWRLVFSFIGALIPGGLLALLAFAFLKGRKPDKLLSPARGSAR